MTYSTGNPTRDLMIAGVLTKMIEHNDPMNLPVAQIALPDDFDLTQTEMDGVLSTLTPQSSEAPTNGVTETPKPPAASVASDPLPETREEALARMHVLQDALATERGRAMVLQQRLRKARDAIAVAVMGFQQGHRPMTREELTREYIASEQKRKAEGRAARRPAHGPGPSVIDAAAFRGARSVNRKYGRSYARPGYFNPQTGEFAKIYPSEMKGAKLPSEQ